MIAVRHSASTDGPSTNTAQSDWFAMAWLVGLLRELNHVSRVRHGYLDRIEED